MDGGEGAIPPSGVQSAKQYEQGNRILHARLYWQVVVHGTFQSQESHGRIVNFLLQDWQSCLSLLVS